MFYWCYGYEKSTFYGIDTLLISNLCLKGQLIEVLYYMQPVITNDVQFFLHLFVCAFKCMQVFISEYATKYISHLYDSMHFIVTLTVA